MKKYIIISRTGWQGSAYYNTFEEANAAAIWRYNCTNILWYVREVWAL